MRFGFDEEQALFQDTLRDFLHKEHPPERIRALWQSETGRSAALWRALGQLGVTGFLVAETHGGMGLDETGFVLVQEEAGRAALAEPLISTAAVAAPLLRDAGAPALAEQWLPRIAAGEARVALGHPVSPFVADAHVADLLLLARGDDEIRVLAPEAVEARAEPANDPARRLATVRFAPSAGPELARGEAARHLLDAALDRGALACAAQLVGVSEQLVDLGVAYANQREQFGRPIGSFQAVKHMLADAKVALEYARPLVYRAAWSVARSDPRRAIHVSMAKVSASEAAQRAARTSLQVHGAIGYTWEQDLHIWMRRAWSLEQAWGSTSFHRRRMETDVLDGRIEIGPGTTF